MVDLLFEISWEVCNKIGGIYAVLSTKAASLHRQYKNKLMFIGPDVWNHEHESPFFTESKTLLRAWKKQVQLPHGLKVRVGRWNIPGHPVAILVDYRSLYAHKDELYGSMWRDFGVDSLHAYGDYDESCMFAFGAALVIESLANFQGSSSQNVVAHFNEWTTGMGLLYVKRHLKQVATVFTTHATSMGRSICGNGKPLYDYMRGYNGNQMAQELNMQSKHSLERAAAHAAHVFTTVSDVTARECEQLLERTPRVTPNGFEQSFVPKGMKKEQCRAEARAHLLQVASALTGAHYGDSTFLVATSGRFEFRNKGLDMVLDSFNVLRTQLETESIDELRHILLFVMVPAWTRGARRDLQQALVAGQVSRLPNPCVTHELHEPQGDLIFSKINELGFSNDLSQRVHIIYVPCYLDGSDGILNMTYYDLLCGFDLSLFPSYYEPWGYTPLESIAFGVPTLTTDLAGFGRWVQNHVGTSFEHTGVCVIHRSDSNYEQAIVTIAQEVLKCYSLDSDSLTKLRAKAQKTSRKAGWKQFIAHYVEAYDEALQIVGKNQLITKK